MIQIEAQGKTDTNLITMERKNFVQATTTTKASRYERKQTASVVPVGTGRKRRSNAAQSFPLRDGETKMTDSSKARKNMKTAGGNRHPNQDIRQGPSDEALRLSEELKELSRQKKLDEALALYRSPDKQNIVDGHHACIVVDCCSRCGRVDEGERIVKTLHDSGSTSTLKQKQP